MRQAQEKTREWAQTQQPRSLQMLRPLQRPTTNSGESTVWPPHGLHLTQHKRMSEGRKEVSLVEGEGHFHEARGRQQEVGHTKVRAR